MTFYEKLERLKELYEKEQTKKSFYARIVEYFSSKAEIENLLNELMQDLNNKSNQQEDYICSELDARIKRHYNITESITFSEFEKEYKTFKILKERGILLIDLAESLLEVVVIITTDEEEQKYNDILKSLEEYFGISKTKKQ